VKLSNVNCFTFHTDAVQMQPKFRAVLFTQVKDAIRSVLKSKNDCFTKKLKRASLQSQDSHSKRGKFVVVTDSDE
jgi:hypothetical protein